MLDGFVLTPDSYKEYWRSYGEGDLHGWRPPKKVYYTLGAAKNGMHHVPKQIRDKIEVHEFKSCCKVDLTKK